MKRVIFIEDGGFLRIEISRRDRQYWLLPVLLFAFAGFLYGLVLICISLISFIKNTDIPIISLVFGLFLSAGCGFGVDFWLFNSFGKETLIFDDNKGSFSYKKSLLKIGLTRKFDYKDISAFIASDSSLPYFWRNRTGVWARCEFEHKGRKFRFGHFRMLEDAAKVTGMINKHIRIKDASIYPTPS